MKFDIPYELRDAFGSALDDEPTLTKDAGGDFYAKFEERAKIAGSLPFRSETANQHVSNFFDEAQEFDKPLAAHYAKLAKIASDAQAKINQPAAPAPAPAGSPYLFAAPLAAPLAKADITSRLYGLLGELRAHCVDGEEELLTKAIKCLDISAFCELSQNVVRRARG